MIDVKNLKVNLESKVLKSSKVVIVPHNRVDFDAIGSAIGLSIVVKRLKRVPYILVNDSNYDIDSGVKLVMDEVTSETDISIIDKNKYLKIASDDDLFILTDVNKKYLVSINEYLKDPSKTIILDHHEPDNDTVISDSSYIDSSISSASEIVVKLLELYKIKLSPNIANYLLAGIYLDTNKLTKNVTPCTMRVVAKLLDWGASTSKVTDLFTEDFVSDRRVQDLVSKAYFISYRIAVLAADEENVYTNEELAKAADYALKYGVNASFAVGRVSEDTISINARAKDSIDVSKIMSNLGGGGNPYAGATKVKDSTVGLENEKLIKLLKPSYAFEKKN